MTRRSGKGGETPAGESKPPAPAKPEGLTQQEVADRIGVSQQAISKWALRGEVTLLDNGRLPESAVETFRSYHQRQQAADAADAAAAKERNEWTQRELRAQVLEREAKAELRALELKRESGRYIDADLVRKDGADVAERVLGVLRAVPQRVALKLECSCRSAAVVQALIREEVERAIAELHESMFIKPKEPTT